MMVGGYMGNSYPFGSAMGRIFRIVNCVSKQKILHLLTQLISILFLAGAVYGILGSQSLPGTEVFALILLAVASYGGGMLLNCLGMPPLLGMLIIGFLFRNLSFIPYYKDISVKWASNLRDISLVVILLKAGIGLDPVKLMQLKLAVLKLSCVPCLLETVASAICVHFLLGLPWLWSFMLGFIICAVSAAVLVPGMLEVEEKNLGVEKGIPTLVMASVSIDNIVALTGFLVTFSILTSTESLTWTLIKRPVEPFIGFTLGGLVGILFWYIPSRNTAKPTLVYYRSVLLLVAAISLQFLSKRVDLQGAGALGCVSLAFVASLEWRTDPEHFKTVTWITGMWWSLIEPFLFGLIGAEVTINSLQNNIGYAFIALFLGILIRALATILALLGSQLDWKEKMFVSAAWLSKATVQAAVGSKALDYARSKQEGEQFIEHSKQVLTMSVLSIIVTAPLGAAFIDYLGPKLLRKKIDSPETSTTDSTEEDEETERISEVTVTDYGSGKSSDASGIKGIMKKLKPNINV